MSIPPTVIFPLSASQKRAASRETVVFPPPDGPIRAVTSPCFAVKDTSFNTTSPVSYENPTLENSMSYPLLSSFSEPSCTSCESISSNLALCTSDAIIAARFCKDTCIGSYILDTTIRNIKNVMTSSFPLANNAPPTKATVAIPSLRIICALPTNTAVPSSVATACFSTALIFSSSPFIYSS